jgi:hypothetical protein
MKAALLLRNAPRTKRTKREFHVPNATPENATVVLALYYPFAADTGGGAAEGATPDQQDSLADHGTGGAGRSGGGGGEAIPRGRRGDTGGGGGEADRQCQFAMRLCITAHLARATCSCPRAGSTRERSTNPTPSLPSPRALPRSLDSGGGERGDTAKAPAARCRAARVLRPKAQPT